MNWSRKNGLIRKIIPVINSGRLKIGDQIDFFASVYNFLNNGFMLNESIDFYKVMHPKLKDDIDKIKDDLSKGHSFAESVRSLVNFRTYCQLRISEYHGDLLTALDNIGRFLKLEKHQRDRLVSLLIYPAFLIVLLIGILIGIRLLVTPQMQSFGQGDKHHKLMWAALVAIPVLILMYGAWRYCHEQSRVWQINTLLKIPLLGKVFRSYYAYYFSSNLALMMSCGMDLKQIVKFMESFKTSPLVQRLSSDLKRSINRGYKISRLRRKYHFLSRNMMLLLDTGDTTDVLAQKLRSYSKVEFQLMIKRSSRLISMLQPVMFLIIGLFITGTYLSMLLPMYNSIKGVY